VHVRFEFGQVIQIGNNLWYYIAIIILKYILCSCTNL